MGIVTPGFTGRRRDDGVELRMLRLLAKRMHESDAPRSQFERLGIPVEDEPGAEHLLVAAQAKRAAEVGAPLPRLEDLPAQDLLAKPLLELLQIDGVRTIIERHLPSLVSTELVAVPAQATLFSLASIAFVTAQGLCDLADDLLRLVADADAPAAAQP